jgi:hypothetical protein
MPTDSNSNPFLDTLIALRDRYLALVTTSALKASHAREQLNHINALLVDQAISIDSAIASAAQLPLVPSPLPALNSSPTADLSDQPAPPASMPTTPGNAQRRNPTKTAGAKARATVASKAASQNGKSQRETVLTLLPAFAGLSKTEAVAQVMTDRAGKAVSLDEIIELLHGKLDINALKQECKRMRTIMWRGVDSKRWQRVKGKDSHYTMPTKLLPAGTGKLTSETNSLSSTAKPARTTRTSAAAPKPAKTSKVSKAKGTAGTPSLMGSVEKVLRDNQDTPMRAEAIATALFGKLSPVRLAEVKKDIADRLAKGAKGNRWQRVPQQLGVYGYP